MPQPIATWNPARGVWETAVENMLCGHLEPYSATLPTSGMTHGGRLYGLPTLVPPTGGPGSSSLPTLPTPAVDDANNLTRDSGAFQSLTRSVVTELLPTPTVMDMGANYTPEEWEAWKAKQKEAHSNGNGHGASLTQEAISLLPTPTVASDRKSRKAMVENEQWSAPGLAQVIELTQGILPREFKDWSEVPGHSGASTPPPSTAGSASSGDPHQPPLFPA